MVNYHLEKRDPALRNFTDACLDLGLEYQIDGCNFYWFQIDDEHPVGFYQRFREIELVFTAQWFEEQKTRIRGLAGAEYIDACRELAAAMPLKDQTRDISYRLPSMAYSEIQI